MARSKKDYVVVSPATDRDISALAELDNIAFEEHAYSRRWYAIRLISDGAENYQAYVARRMSDRKALGFCFLELDGDVIHIKKIGVSPIYRRTGVGKALLLQAIVEKPHFVNTIVTHVPEEILGAQLFFKSFGFKWERTKPDAFPKRECTAAYVMVWKESDYDLSQPNRST